MNREDKIKKGKIWRVWLGENPDNTVFKGSKTAAYAFLKSKVPFRLWKTGKTDWHIGQLLWE